MLSLLLLLMPPCHPVTEWHYWYGIGLTIHRLQLPVLPGHYCTVALGKLLTPVCLCHQQYNVVPVKCVMPVAGKVTVGLAESNDNLPLGL